jgi:hypothetical protein
LTGETAGPQTPFGVWQRTTLGEGSPKVKLKRRVALLAALAALGILFVVPTSAHAAFTTVVEDSDTIFSSTDTESWRVKTNNAGPLTVGTMDCCTPGDFWGAKVYNWMGTLVATGCPTTLPRGRSVSGRLQRPFRRPEDDDRSKPVAGGATARCEARGRSPAPTRTGSFSFLGLGRRASVG